MRLSTSPRTSLAIVGSALPFDSTGEWRFWTETKSKVVGWEGAGQVVPLEFDAVLYADGGRVRSRAVADRSTAVTRQPCWPDAPITEGTVVGVLGRHFGVWSLNACRIVYVIEEQASPLRRYGFAFGTLPAHVERGEERFTV